MHNRERRFFEEIQIKGDKNMRMKWSKKISSFILCMMLIVAMAFTTTGCNGRTDKEAPSRTGTEADVRTEVTVLGEGGTVFEFLVVDKEGAEAKFEIHTDKEMVGEALLDLGLIAGEEGDYGLFVKTVNGITADYDADGVYWAFYINGEYAQTGVGDTPIAEGEAYSFKVE